MTWRATVGLLDVQMDECVRILTEDLDLEFTPRMNESWGEYRSTHIFAIDGTNPGLADELMIVPAEAEVSVKPIDPSLGFRCFALIDARRPSEWFAFLRDRVPRIGRFVLIDDESTR